MNITITHWGYAPSGESIYLFQLTNVSGASIELTNLGASWVSTNMPNKYDIFENILLGYDSVEGYIKDSYYMGATIGRFANRIHQASCSIKGTTFQLEKNDGENTNHGGLSGFHKKIWQWKQTESGIRFILHSPDMEGGYPGNIQVEVEYQFTEVNELTIDYHGITDCPTYLNLTNHSYFNLSGDKRNIAEHQLMIPATRILETTSQFIPTGQVQDVKDSPFDFTTNHSIGTYLYDDDEQLYWNKGYNHYYILKEQSSDTLLTAAVLSDPFSGRRLTVMTDLPGVLLYTAGYLAPIPHIGVCLETQYFPDSPSHPHFPSCLLMPDKEYHHRTIYTFEK